jgi:flagellar biosynthesis protein FlhB
VTLAGGVSLYMMGGDVGGRLHEMMQRSFTLSREQATDAAWVVPSLVTAAGEALRACAPIYLVVLLAAVIAPLALGGWNFSSEAFQPKLNRLNPIEGVKRIVSLRSLVELVKALAKFAVVAVIAATVLWSESPSLLALGREPTLQSIGHAAQLAGQGLIYISAGLLLIAAIDAPYQLWQHAKQMRMSRQEIRDEHKETEGSPEIKGRIRQVQQQMARQRMMADVPKADVIVTNPTHFAVALRYDDKHMRAPIVVAKGADLVAARIRELGGEHNVPIFEAPPLARVLYRNVDIGAEIPANLYIAVAQVLSYIFQLRVATRSGMQPPPKPTVEVAE